MLAGLDAFNSSFLLDLNTTEDKISQTNRQITSGFRVNQASDDPTAIAAILGYQNQIDQVNQVQTNMGQAATEASVADGALSTASTMLDQLTSIAAQGASGTATAETRTTLGLQVQAIAQQLVTIANTNIQGRYIFGGDDPSTVPYTYNASVPGGAVQNNIAPSTATIQNASGETLNPRMTAQQIFGAQNPDGTPAPGNILQTVYDLSQALLANDQSGVTNATTALKASATQLGQATTSYGNTENWIQTATTDASSSLVSLQTALSGLRDTDVAAAASELTLEQTSMQAALAAHSSLNIKSLFSYMG